MRTLFRQIANYLAADGMRDRARYSHLQPRDHFSDRNIKSYCVCQVVSVGIQKVEVAFFD
jgi:hypothetical protein